MVKPIWENPTIYLGKSSVFIDVVLRLPDSEYKGMCVRPCVPFFSRT